MSASRGADFMRTDIKIKRVLIANRGEIARRIRRACEALEIETVLVSSDADANSLAVRESPEVALIGGSTARDSYLNGPKIVEAALKFGCQAIHPGYGFLSEDAAFAQSVIDAGLVFIGPAPESITALGVKTLARKTVLAAGVPITPGSGDAVSDEELQAAAQSIGFPVIIKAAAGGGGRGMRIVRDASEMKESLERARAEALKNFGNATVYCEKFIEQPRHVEVQLFGDMHGNVVHFGTRDCSAQRRHQKLVEEAPAPFLDPETRENIHQAAVLAAKSVGYYNAGTAEFLVQGRQFYFLEINTRIQVEHPVTEAITGVDLVQLQLKVAMGERLPFSQEQISFKGHAVELRINAEDVFENFRPALGTISSWKRPANGKDLSGIREDYGYEVGSEVTPFYDSLLSKVIAFGDTRQEALYRAYRFLREYSIGGVPTSIPFHAWILANPEFQGPGIDIGYVERTFTAESAREALSLLEIDPTHRAPEGEVTGEPVDRVYITLPHGERRAIDLVHEVGGTFLAIPLGDNGAPLAKSEWRRGMSREAVLRGG
jgi:acetyl-CoA carboxylase biotin carboxylase subunit